MSLAYWLNTAWMLKCWPEATAFRRATDRVAETQEAVLREIISKNRTTEFGLRYRFGEITRPREFQQHVPPSTYDDYKDSIGRIATGCARVLTSDPVRLLEPTSGTSGGEKLIPYTESLRRQFQRAVATWVADLFWNRPAVRNGRAYWSISPAVALSRESAAAIPIGFASDTEYLGSLERFALRRLLVTPPEVAQLSTIEICQYSSLLSLLYAEDLALISVWSPTFLCRLVGKLEEWVDRIICDIREGTFSPPTSPACNEAACAASRREPNSRRAERLTAIFASNESLAEKLSRVWPRLALVSCWADAASGRYVPELEMLFPKVEFQPKGLLATEGCVTIPQTECSAPCLAIRSHFFEFELVQHGAGSGTHSLAHELELGCRYRVIITTGGGLYRYQLRDEVEVVGFERQCPLMRFLGKADRVSDLVGEKLAEPHVRDTLDRLFSRNGIRPTFAMLAPNDGKPPYYRLYLEASNVDRDVSITEMESELQVGLEENPHYCYAVQLGQLAPVRIDVLAGPAGSGWRAYEGLCLSHGQKQGNIKPIALDSRLDWSEHFNVTRSR